MQNINSVIAKLKEAVDCKTDVELAKVLSISPSTISTWKKRNSIPYDKIEDVSKRFQIPFVWFITEEAGGTRGFSPNLVPILKRIPTGFPVAIQTEDYEGYFSVPGSPQEAFALIAQDESMAPVLRQGDYLLFIPTQELQSGDLGLFIDDWGQILARRYREKEGRYFLVSENSEFPTLPFTEEFKILGRVVDVWRKIGF